MAYRITQDCIVCNKCIKHCPVEAIFLGDDIYEIDADKCVECVGFSNEPNCVSVCPVDVIFKIVVKI